MCSADNKQVEKNKSPCFEVLTQKPPFPYRHIQTSAFLSSCYLEFQVLGGSEGEGGGSNITEGNVRRSSHTGAPSPQVRLSDLCNHLTGLLQRLDTGK